MSETIIWLFAFLAAYVAYGLYWGLAAARMSPAPADFLLGGKSLSPAVFVLVATGFCLTGWIALGHPSMIYQAGFPFAQAAMAAILIPLTGVLFLKRQWVLGTRFGYLTQGDLLADYFSGEAIRLLSVLIAVVFAVPFLAMQMSAAGRLVEGLTGGVADRHAATWVLAFAVFLSVSIGGFRAMSFVGALQALLAISGMVALGCLAYVEIGGFAALNAAMARLAAAPEANAAGLFAIPGVLQFTAGVDDQAPPDGLWTTAMILTYCLALAGLQASPAFTMIGMSCRNADGFAAQQVWSFAGVIGVILLFFAVGQGMAAHFLGASADVAKAGLAVADRLPARPSGAYVDMTAPYLQSIAGTDPWLAALLALCAIAALQLAAAVFAVTTATALTIDLYKRFVRPEAGHGELKLAARVAMAGVFLAALLATTFAPRATASIGTIALSCAVQLVPALAGLCWYAWITREGATLGVIAGLVAVVLTEPIGAVVAGLVGLDLPWGRWPWTIHSAGWGLACNVLVCGFVSLATRGGEARRHRAMFHQVLDQFAELPPRKRMMKPAVWALALAWAFFAIGPGAIIGNDLFGAPAGGLAAWNLGVPSLWAWQMIWWALGVLVIWWLAYKMEFSTVPLAPVRAEGPDRGAGGAGIRPPRWIRDLLRHIV